jgi:hypothetical protein
VRQYLTAETTNSYRQRFKAVKQEQLEVDLQQLQLMNSAQMSKRAV